MTEHAEQPNSIEELNRIENPNSIANLNTAEEAMVSKKSDGYKKFKSGELALMQMSANPDLSMSDSKKAADRVVDFSPNLDEEYDAVMQRAATRLTDTAYRNLQELVNLDPENIVLAQEIGTATETFKNDIMKGYRGVGETLVYAQDRHSQTKTPEDLLFRQEMAVKQAAYSRLADLIEGKGTWNKVSSFGGILFNPGMTLASEEIDDLLGKDSSFNKVIAAYQQSTPEEKFERFPSLLAAADEAFDSNVFKLAWFVDTLHDPEFVTASNVGRSLSTTEQVLALTPFAPIKTIKAMKSLNSIKKRAKDLGVAEDAARASLKGDLAEEPLDQALDASAFRWEDIDDGAVDGYAELYNKVRDEAAIIEHGAQVAKRVAKESELSPLTAQEGAKLQAEFKRKLLSQDGVSDVKVVSSDEKGFVAEYTVLKTDPQDLSKTSDVVTQQYVYTKDDVTGTFAIENATFSKNVVGKLAATPDTQFRMISDELVDETTFGGFQASRLNNQLQELWKRTGSNVPKKSNQTADEIIIAGDAEERVFTIHELKSGQVQTASGKRSFTDDEIVAYYNKVAYNKELFGLANYTIRRKLDFLGFKEGTWIDDAGNKVRALVKPLQDSKGLTQNSDDLIFVQKFGANETDDVVRRGSVDAAEMNKLGYTAVQFQQPMKVGGKNVSWGYIKTNDKTSLVKELPDVVLHEVTGWAPRVIRPGLYYVKDANTGRTFARFRKKENAQAYAAKQNQIQIDSEVPSGEFLSHQVVRDRDFNTMDTLTEDSNVFGGLIYGARNRDGIFEGDDLVGQAYRLSTSQSIQRVNQSISNVMPLNTFKMGMVERWKNTVKAVLQEQGIPKDNPIYRAIDDPSQWTDLPLGAITNNTQRSALESIRKYMIDQFSIPTNKEASWTNFMMNVADRMASNDKLHDAAVSLAYTDPVRALKGTTFNLMLGWFNPRQLYVQAQNAALAMSMYPLKGLAAAKDAMAMRTVMFAKGDEATKQIAKILKDDDLVENVRQLKESGLLDSIWRNADYDAQRAGMTGGTLDSVRKMAEKGLIFYREGEGFSRMIAWNIARRNWKEANPGKVIDKKAIKEITKDSLRMNMNMQRENAAWWQGNLATGNSTQFLQVQAKLIENLWQGIFSKSGKWTQKEAGMALAGQIVLYGAVGVPIVEQANEYFKGKSQESGEAINFNLNNPNAAKTLDQGITGVLTGALGFENDFSSAGGILKGLSDNVVIDLLKMTADLYTGEKSPTTPSALEVFLGPSGTTVKRSGDTILGVASAAYDVAVHPTLDTVGKSAFKAFDSIASLTSTWSNARKVAYLHKVGGLLDKNGNIIVSQANLEGLSTKSMLAKAMGMPLDIEQAYWEQKIFNFDRKKQKADSIKALKETYRQYQADQNVELFKAKGAMILAEYEDQPLIRQEVMKNFLDSVYSGSSKLDKEIQVFINEYVKSGGKLGFKSFQADLRTDKEGQE